MKHKLRIVLILIIFSINASAQKQVWRLYQTDSFGNQISLEQDTRNSERMRVIFNQEWSWRNDAETNLAVYNSMLEAYSMLGKVPQGSHVQLGSWSGRPDSRDPYSQGKTQLTVFASRNYIVLSISDQVQYMHQDVIFSQRDIVPLLESYALILQHLGISQEQIPVPPQPAISQTFQADTHYIVQNGKLIEIPTQANELPHATLPAHLAPPRIHRIPLNNVYPYRRGYDPLYYPTGVRLYITP